MPDFRPLRAVYNRAGRWRRYLVDSIGPLHPRISNGFFGGTGVSDCTVPRNHLSLLPSPSEAPEFGGGTIKLFELNKRALTVDASRGEEHEASSQGSDRILSPIVLAQALLVASRQSDFGPCRAVGAQLVGHQRLGGKALFLEQLAQQFHGCGLVAPSMHEQVENLAFIVDSAPEPEIASQQSSPPSHRDAIAPSTEGVDGEVLGRTIARTSKPIAVPFRRRHPDRAPRADLQRRDS